MVLQRHPVLWWIFVAPIMVVIMAVLFACWGAYKLVKYSAIGGYRAVMWWLDYSNRGVHAWHD